MCINHDAKEDTDEKRPSNRDNVSMNLVVAKSIYSQWRGNWRIGEKQRRTKKYRVKGTKRGDACFGVTKMAV